MSIAATRMAVILCIFWMATPIGYRCGYLNIMITLIPFGSSILHPSTWNHCPLPHPPVPLSRRKVVRWWWESEGRGGIVVGLGSGQHSFWAVYRWRTIYTDRFTYSRIREPACYQDYKAFSKSLRVIIPFFNNRLIGNVSTG